MPENSLLLYIGGFMTWSILSIAIALSDKKEGRVRADLLLAQLLISLLLAWITARAVTFRRSAEAAALNMPAEPLLSLLRLFFRAAAAGAPLFLLYLLQPAEIGPADVIYVFSLGLWRPPLEVMILQILAGGLVALDCFLPGLRPFFFRSGRSAEKKRASPYLFFLILLAEIRAAGLFRENLRLLRETSALLLPPGLYFGGR